MPTYTEGFRARMVQRLAGPDAISAQALSKEVGVSQNTLSRWLREALTLESMGRKKKARGSDRRRWTAEEKLRIVFEAAKLSEEELGAFLRREGLHEAQLAEWRSAVEKGGAAALAGSGGPKRLAKASPDKKRVRELERELNRKDKALAEVTALLALKKKVQELWGDEDDRTRKRRGT